MSSSESQDDKILIMSVKASACLGPDFSRRSETRKTFVRLKSAKMPVFIEGVFVARVPCHCPYRLFLFPLCVGFRLRFFACFHSFLIYVFTHSAIISIYTDSHILKPSFRYLSPTSLSVCSPPSFQPVCKPMRLPLFSVSLLCCFIYFLRTLRDPRLLFPP